MQTLSEKLRLAATIVEANDNIHEYQAADGSGPWYKGAAFNISSIIARGFNIRRIDPYAELKAAHAAGKVIQYNCSSNNKPEWEDVPNPEFMDVVDAYRIKPTWTLSRHIEGFRPLAESEQWHRIDFTEDMLPKGWRPLLKGEAIVYGKGNDEFKLSPSCADSFEWQSGLNNPPGSPMLGLWRTRRPLPPIYKTVKLGPEDVPSGSWVKLTNLNSAFAVTEVRQTSIIVGAAYAAEKSFDTLMSEEWQINRSIALGKWDSNAWEPCSKEVEV